MAKILFIGDPHLKISRLETCKEFLRWVNNTIDDVKPDLVVNLGDTFDTHAVLRSEVLSEFKAHVAACTVPYIYVLGNHDMYKPNDSKYHALQPFDIPHMKIIDKIEDVDGVTYVPYQHSIADFPLDTLPICVAHQTFVGADYGYYRPDVGVDADKVSAEIIISGHIHKRQSFGKVVYPGTPYAHDLNDINQSKGLMLFDTSNYKYDFIDSPFPGWRGFKLNMSDFSSTDELHDTVVDSIDQSNHWVVDISGPKAELSAYIVSKKLSKLQEDFSLRIRPAYTDSTKIQTKKIKAVSMDSIVHEYIDTIYEGTIDRGLLKKKATQLLNNAEKNSV